MVNFRHKHTSDNQPGRGGELLSFVSIIMASFVFALIIAVFIVRFYSVDGPSMEPTLQNQNKLIVWKLPRTWASITGNQYIPKRGDIIVFNDSDLAACGQPGTRQLIKRVIGLPGNKIVINNGIVTVYSKNHPKGFQPDKQLPYNTNNFIQPTTPNMTLTLNSHQLFVLGDNRPVSCDSRIFGPINTDQVVGQVRC